MTIHHFAFLIVEHHDVGVTKKPAEEESRPPPKEKSQKALASGKFKGPEKAAKAETEAVAAASPALKRQSSRSSIKKESGGEDSWLPGQ